MEQMKQCSTRADFVAYCSEQCTIHLSVLETETCVVEGYGSAFERWLAKMILRWMYTAGFHPRTQNLSLYAREVARDVIAQRTKPAAANTQ